MKNILKTTIIIIINALSNTDMAAQVIKKTVTEHFTNSNCSVCASNNPGFYATLDKYPDVLHIAFYPSSPYPNCYFSQQNPLENDARTKFYGLYGSTPRFTVNGMVTSLSSMDARLNSESSATANFDIRSRQTQLAYDSIKVEIVIKKVATDTMKAALLFSGSKEDTVFYESPNGEKIHQDVFRKSLSGIEGDLISLPGEVNDSLILNYTYKVNQGWDFNRLQTISFLQDKESKEIINASESNKLINKFTAGVNYLKKTKVQLFPNPAQSEIKISSRISFEKYGIYTLTGRKIKAADISNNTISVEGLDNGIYLLELVSKEGISNTKIIISK